MVDMTLEELDEVKVRIAAEQRWRQEEISEYQREDRLLERYKNDVEARRHTVCKHLNPDGTSAIEKGGAVGDWCRICGWNDY